MQGNKGKRRLLRFARGFAALWALLAVAAAGSASAAPTLTVLHPFPGSHRDGAVPEAGLIADSAGNLYGTTTQGGASGTLCGGFGCGVVFKLSPDGSSYEGLHSFVGGGDGASPQAGLIADSAGNLYGTTEFGGASGNGVVFKLSLDGSSYTGLFSFASRPSDGAFPIAGLIADGAGNLYGTTVRGGAPDDGVGFKLSPPIPPATKWTETVLHSFCSLPGCSDGSFPQAGLIADSAGNLYGTTYIGGASGNGVVFKLSPPIPPATKWTETVLHSFAGRPSDGAFPIAGLIADGAGNLYGTTEFGGAITYGVVFKLSPPVPPATKWTETVLHSFEGVDDGLSPFAGLIADSTGNLYGITPSGGALGGGAVFKLSPPIPPATKWAETVLYCFCILPGCSNVPHAGLIADSAGNLYGTALAGASNGGVVFKLAGTGFVTP